MGRNLKVQDFLQVKMFNETFSHKKERNEIYQIEKPQSKVNTV